MTLTNKSPEHPRRGATGLNLKTSQANHNTQADYRARVRGLLPAGMSALYGQACTCTKDGAPCPTCRGYSEAGKALEQAADALRCGGSQ